MSSDPFSRRSFVGAVGTLAGGSLLFQNVGCKQRGKPQPNPAPMQAGSAADYTVTIAVKPVELAPNRIVSTTTYNGQFPGPLLRFKEGQQVTIDINNQTDTPEQLHWHGQFLSTDVDGAAEEGTPFIPAHGSRRITFVPKPSGYRFYHTHVHAGANLTAGQYTGSVGPVYIEPKNNSGNYDREVFLEREENLAIVVSRIVLRFDIYRTDRARVLSGGQICPRMDVGVVEAIPGRLGHERNAAASMSGNERRAFFRGAIDIGRKKLPVPMQLLGRVRLVVDVDRELLAFFEAEQRPGELTVVGSCGDDAIRGQLHRLHGDGHGVIRRTAGLHRGGVGLGFSRLLAADVLKK